MNKHLKLFSALLVLMLFAPVSMFVCPADAEAAQTLVENSWRYEGGLLVSDDASSEEDGIALLSMDALPDGVTAQGIDVSEHQGRIDWDAVKASGIDFAILRVGFGAPSFGGRVDYQFNRNISECERLGIPYGVYVYSYAFDNQQAADEASMVINCLSGHNPRLPVYYDLEDNSIIANGRQTGIALRAQVFCNRISAAGYEPGIYANLNWFNNILTDSVFKSSSWDHWIAQYNSQCDYTGNYSFWQYKSNGKVPGINGNVDMNYAYVDVSLYHWQLIDSTWYYAASNGKAYTGWLFQSGTWYWLEPDVGGAMATGFHECNGSLYWFNSSGAMATGWVLDGGTWYYATGSGALARGPVSVGGVPYCFDARTGAMLTGYQTDAQGVRRYFGSCGPLNGWGLVDGSWYWFADGIASTGWLYTGGSWYWLDPDAGGAMATGLHACNGSAYWFSASGAMATGWVLDGGTWYYATGSGALASGWLNLNGAWYWLDPSTHAMATGVQTIGSCEYIFNSTGKMMANCWSNGDGSWMYHSSSSGAIDLKGIMTDSGIQLIDDDGNARTGWIESQGARYYCSASGVILTGWQQIAGSWYYFNPDGRMATGWLNDGSNWYWLDSASGAMKTGWLNDGGTWYWLQPSGAMFANGWLKIDGVDYYFNASGAWLNTSGSVLGVNRSSLVNWLMSHENDGYYRGTRYDTHLSQETCMYPKGDPRWDGYTGMNCGGFVSHAYMKAGGNLAPIAAEQSHSPWSGGPGRGGCVNAYRWYGYAIDTCANVTYFNSIDELLRSGLARKGDIVFFNPYNPYADDSHIGFFWGNSPSENLFWHSDGYGNRISGLTALGPSKVILIR